MATFVGGGRGLHRPRAGGGRGRREDGATSERIGPGRRQRSAATREPSAAGIVPAPGRDAAARTRVRGERVLLGTTAGERPRNAPFGERECRHQAQASAGDCAPAGASGGPAFSSTTAAAPSPISAMRKAGPTASEAAAVSAAVKAIRARRRRTGRVGISPGAGSGSPRPGMGAFGASPPSGRRGSGMRYTERDGNHPSNFRTADDGDGAPEAAVSPSRTLPNRVIRRMLRVGGRWPRVSAGRRATRPPPCGTRGPGTRPGRPPAAGRRSGCRTATRSRAGTARSTPSRRRSGSRTGRR